MKPIRMAHLLEKYHNDTAYMDYVRLECCPLLKQHSWSSTHDILTVGKSGVLKIQTPELQGEKRQCHLCAMTSAQPDRLDVNMGKMIAWRKEIL